jgi:hypothetical protein
LLSRSGHIGREGQAVPFLSIASLKMLSSFLDGNILSKPNSRKTHHNV